MNKEVIPLEKIAETILVIRGEKVILDTDLARLYGVQIKRLNEQVKRNQERFPEDFMFQLNEDEAESLRSQFATLKNKRGQHRKYLPYAFTEHGAIMAASVLNSAQAIEMSVYIVRAFVKLKTMLATHKELAGKLDELENRVTSHDQILSDIITAIRQLTSTPVKPKRQIGFKAKM